MGACFQCGSPDECNAVSWEDLNSFKVHIFPDTLTVVTNATKEDVLNALFRSKMNLDDALRKQGFTCLISGKLSEDIIF